MTVLLVDAQTTYYAVADLIVLIVDASLTCAEADTLVIVVDALTAQAWAVSTALKVDAPKARVGSDSMVLTKTSRMTHAGDLLEDAPKILAVADFKVLQ